MNTDLKIIKKMYGEKMMHLCRELFPTILEHTGLLSFLLRNKFEPSRFLYDDIVEDGYTDSFKNYIYSLLDLNNDKVKTNKTPKELLEEAGYDLYECKTESDIQKFKKYYAKDEKLCTFDGERLNRCYVFFAVKKNVDEIKRENFKNPERQDEYGTSVISIQFTRGEINVLSIKNRYNHTVNNPDATFSNNLDKIIPGLTESFERVYNLNINQNDSEDFEMVDYVRADNGVYYKYNYELGNIYYCPNNVIIDNFRVKKFPKDRYIVLDYFILDLQNKTIKLYDYAFFNDPSDECFTHNIKEIEKINVIKNGDNKKIELITKRNNKIIIVVDNHNRIIEYINPEIEKLGDNFLYYNETLKHIDMPNLKKVGDHFLRYDDELISVNLPNLLSVGDYFLDYSNISSIDLPNLTSVGYGFLVRNLALNNLNCPNLKEVGGHFLKKNQKLNNLDLPSLIKVGDSFLAENRIIKSISLPNVISIGNNFLYSNENLLSIDMPNLESVGDYFLRMNEKLNLFKCPKLKEEHRINFNNHLYTISDNLYRSKIISTEKVVTKNKSKVKKL